MVIVSKSNDKIKYINSLKDKKYRDKYNKYILEGIKLVNEGISSGDNTLEFIVLSRELLESHQGGKELYANLKDLDNVLEVDSKVFEYLSDTETPQGVLVVLDKRKNTLKDLIDNINNNEKVIVLDKIQDAGNMGTIIRTAVAFGINNIVCLKGSVDEMKEVKQALTSNGYDLCGTDLKATKYLNETKPNNKTVYVLGNEANGMSEEMKDICDSFVKIPMESVQESLNVGVAAAILMYNGYIGGEA